MNEIQPYRNDFVTERAKRLYFALNKLHYLEGLKEEGKVFGFVQKGKMVAPWPHLMEGVQSVIKSLQGDLEEQGEEKLATEIIVFDKKCHTSEVPEVFRKALE